MMLKISLWFKLYGGYLLSFIVLVLGAVFFISDHEKISSLKNQLNEQNNANKEQLRKLQETQLQERERNEAISTAYRDAVAKVEATKNEQIQRLAVTQQEQLKQITENYHDNPQEMANRVNELFGFQVYTNAQ